MQRTPKGIVWRGFGEYLIFFKPCIIDDVLKFTGTAMAGENGGTHPAQILSSFVCKSREQTCQKVSRISRESHAFSLNSRFSARLNIISRIIFYLSYALISQEN